MAKWIQAPMKRAAQIILGFMLFGLLSAAHATAIFAITTGTPQVTVAAGETVTITYQVQNQSDRNIPSKQMSYYPSSLTKLVTGTTCPGTPFSAAASFANNTSCTMALRFTAPNAPGKLALSLGVCGSGACSQPNSKNLVTATITSVFFTIMPTGDGHETITPSSQTVDYGNTTFFTVTPSAGYTLQPATGTCPSGSFAGDVYTTGTITANCTLTFSATANHYAYIANENSATAILYCPINSDSTFGTCNPTGSFNDAVYVTINPSGTAAYVADYGTEHVLYCLINSSTGAFASCSNTTTSTSFLYLQGVAINPAGTVAYVMSLIGIYYCQVGSDGLFSDCTYSSVSPYSGGIVVNPTANYLYVITEGGSQVNYCPIDPSSNPPGDLSNCTSTGSGFSGPSGIAINPAGTYVYVSNGNSSIVYCSVSTSGGNMGALTNCTATSGIPYEGGIAINSTNTYVYVATSDTSIAYCPVNANGSLGSCSNAGGSGFNSPISIATFPPVP